MSSIGLQSRVADALRLGANAGIAISNGDEDNRREVLQCGMEASMEQMMSSVKLFPPELKPSKLEQMRKRLATEWVHMEKWTSLGFDPVACLAECKKAIIKKDVQKWIETVKNAAGSSDDPFAGARACSDAIWQLANAFDTGAMARYHRFCARVGVSYATLVINGIDKQLASICVESVERALHAVNKDPDTDAAYSKATMTMCCGAAHLRDAIKGKRKESLEPLDLEKYESWFRGGLVFWTFSWKSTSKELVRRVLHRAEQLQRAEYNSAHSVEYGESVIDILTMCKGIISNNILEYIRHIVKVVSDMTEVDAHKQSYVTKSDIDADERKDDLLRYLESHLSMLQEKLVPTLMPIGARALWNQTCAKVDAHLRSGQDVEYYDRVQENIPVEKNSFVLLMQATITKVEQNGNSDGKEDLMTLTVTPGVAYVRLSTFLQNDGDKKVMQVPLALIEKQKLLKIPAYQILHSRKQLSTDADQLASAAVGHIKHLELDVTPSQSYSAVRKVSKAGLDRLNKAIGSRVKGSVMKAS